MCELFGRSSSPASSTYCKYCWIPNDTEASLVKTRGDFCAHEWILPICFVNSQKPKQTETVHRQN